VPLDRRILFGEPGSPEHAQAQAAAKVLSDDARAKGFVFQAPPPPGETVSDYASRWLEEREGRVASVRDNAGHLKNHILPVIGAIPMARVTRHDVESVVADLDAKVRAGKLSTKSAINLWGTCSKLFDDATNAKPATVRIPAIVNT
jgi:hypothetical protein